jgi:hypothetical protein
MDLEFGRTGGMGVCSFWREDDVLICVKL